MDKSKFSHDIIPCKIHADGRKYPYEITENMWYKWEGIKGVIPPTVIVVPKTYCTDLVSVPWAFQWAIKPSGKAAMPAIYHDIGCSTEVFKVQQVNDMMNSAMKDWGIGPSLRIPVYCGIYAGCWLTWRQHVRKEVAEDRALVASASKEVWDEYGSLFSGYAKI
jgi:hypothetical protein